MQIKINGIFYPLTSNNLIQLPSICSDKVSYISITSDGYITTEASSSNGQGRLIFPGVNASSLIISTNDGGGIVVANPCTEPLSIQVKTFNGFTTGNCEVKLEFESAIESNVRNIELEGSSEGVAFSKLLELFPQGSDSRYTAQCKTAGSNFYRLKINDLDGNFSYSEIIRINNICASSPIRISPNPASQKIFIENVQRDDQLILVDFLGRQLFRLQALENSIEINTDNLAPGNYFFKVLKKNGKVEIARFLKVI